MSKFASMALVVDQPARMDIYHPKTGVILTTPQGDPCYIDIFPFDAEVAQKYERDINNKRLSQRVRTSVKVEEIEAEQVGRLAVVTAGWQLAGLNGEEVDIPFSPQNAKELYAEPGMRWVRDQVERFLGDRGNFTPDSSKSSSPSPSTASDSTAATTKGHRSAKP